MVSTALNIQENLQHFHHRATSSQKIQKIFRQKSFHQNTKRFSLNMCLLAVSETILLILLRWSNTLSQCGCLVKIHTICMHSAYINLCQFQVASLGTARQLFTSSLKYLSLAKETVDLGLHSNNEGIDLLSAQHVVKFRSRMVVSTVTNSQLSSVLLQEKCWVSNLW